MFTISFTM